MNKKLVVRWQWNIQQFVCRHPHCNVVGFGRTPGEAIRNWIFWWEYPY